MTELPPDAPNVEPSTPEIEKKEKAKKKKDKVRSAWISFFGRIIAQMLGAAAAIFLGLMFVQHRASGAAASDARAAVTAAVITPRTTPDARSLAVLPFQNFSGDPAADAFADGMTEAVTATLSQVPSLRVVSRTSSMSYGQGRKSLPEIAGELRVRWVLEGSCIRRGDRTRVTVQLIDAETDQHRWAQTYDRTERDFLTLHAVLAAAIAQDVRRALALEDEL